MGNFKYQLLEAEDSSPKNISICQCALKVFAICALFVLIVYYNSPTANNNLSATVLRNRHVLQYISTEKTLESEASTNSPVDLASTTFISTQFDSLTSTSESFFSTTPKNIIDPNYYVYTSQCQMPKVNPFTKDVLRIFKKTAYKSCDSSKDIITVVYDPMERLYRLHINVANFTCCYKQILRSGSGAQADNKFKLLPCRNFEQDYVVPQEVDAILTECHALNDTKVTQKDAFGFVQAKKEEFNKSKVEGLSFERRPSVLLWGIDSMSRMNFQRTMPRMFKYLKEANWFELQGYNKMGDNTYPNLLAILTGYNNSRALSVCRPRAVGGLDACTFLWNVYKDRGYRTAYAEDWSKCATFNYNKKGFVKPPTDYYGRPLMLAVAQELKNVKNMNIPYCVGRKHYAEYAYDAALQFTRVFKNESSFGMFWTNSFSHNNFALPSSMDAKVLEYMRSLNSSGIFDNSIVLFFSDHGMRFGQLRKLVSGFLEERMPILYIWLPEWFRKKYPKFAKNLQLNRNRLTSPYDIHATLKHILELETPKARLPIPEGCSSCHSVFFEVDEARNCARAGIDDHWCSCNSFLNISLSDTNIKNAAEQLVNATNNYLSVANLTALCQTLKLSKIQSVLRKINTDTKGSETYLIRYQVEPSNALFEASIAWSNKSHRISIDVPDISRLDHYHDLSTCVSGSIAQKYCICYS